MTELNNEADMMDFAGPLPPQSPCPSIDFSLPRSLPTTPKSAGFPAMPVMTGSPCSLISGFSFSTLNSPSRNVDANNATMSIVTTVVSNLQAETEETQDETDENKNTLNTRKRSFDELHDEGYQGFQGFESLAREDESNGRYRYNKWKKRPVFMKKYGELNDEVQRRCIRKTLRDPLFLESKYHETISRVYLSGENEWMKSTDFMARHGFSTDERYNNALMFFPFSTPYATPSRPQCFEARFDLSLKKRRARQLRVNPVYVEVMKELDKDLEAQQT